MGKGSGRHSKKGGSRPIQAEKPGRPRQVQGLLNLLRNHPKQAELIGTFSEAERRQILESLGRAGIAMAGSEAEFHRVLIQVLHERQAAKAEAYLNGIASKMQGTPAERAEFSRELSLAAENIRNWNDPLLKACFGFQEIISRNSWIYGPYLLKDLTGFLSKARAIDFKKLVGPFLRGDIKPEEVKFGIRHTWGNMAPEYDGSLALFLGIKGKSVGLMSFDFSPFDWVLSIEQLQGVEGFDTFGASVLSPEAAKLQKNVRWERCLIRCGTEIARLLGAREVRVISSDAVIARDKIPPEAHASAKMHYNVTAKREHFEPPKPGQKYWTKKIGK
jgi:hypothetical protein